MRSVASRPPVAAARPAFILWALAALATSLLLALAAPAAAQGEAPDLKRDDGLVRQGQIDGGALLLRTDEPGLYVPAPILKTKIDVAVAGAIARTVVTQRFENPAKVFVEGKYIFPLPEGAAVDTLKMRIGDRLIEGEVKERQEAKEIYEQAKAEGFKASLVEQERPNLFTTSVANIGPSETVVVQIEYQETLAPRDGVFGLRVPLVVAPRYVPKEAVATVKFGPEGWKLVSQPRVDDAARIAAPVVDPREDAEAGVIRNPVELTVDLQAGFPLGPVRSLYHKVQIDPQGQSGAKIAIDGEVPADRDFYLSWSPATLKDPYLTVFTEKRDDATHYLMMLTPPAAEAIGDTRKPREVIFVQDISGSMSGESIEQAREGLELAVKRLQPDDKFNIIVFNDRYGQLFDAPVLATADNMVTAVNAVRALKADGGTEMLPALEAALKDAEPDAEDRIRQVIFLTDGAVGNEREMLRLIERDLGRSRLFTVGIGSAPNSYFMVRAAEVGRGTHVFIGDLAEVKDRMEALFAKIETPAVTDLDLEVDGWTSAEVWPKPLPDLYAGDPVVATVRVADGSSTRAIPALTVSGKRAGVVWAERVALADAEERVGVSKLWARQRIRSLEALYISPDVDQKGREAIDAEILGTALKHSLVSRLTSLVAVDVTPSRKPDEELVSKNVPLALPKGWDAAAFFDEEELKPAEPGVTPTGGETEAAPLIKAKAIERLAAAAEAKAAARAQSAPIPQGSTEWLLAVLAGLALLLLSVALFLTGRGARRA